MRISLLLVLLILSTACASKKNVKDSSAAIAVKEELLLNGSSDDGKAGQLRTVHFAYNADQLDKMAKEILKDNARYLEANKNIAIQIEGHCDEKGGRQYNLALGERRAKTVRDYLRALGIKAFRMKTISLGSERPIDERNSEDAWSRNRRGTFVVISL